MSTWAVPVWTEMKGWIKRRGWMMHLAHWSMQTQMCPKYLMQTIPASHYPEKLSAAWGSCQDFFPLSFSSFTLFSHTDKPKNTHLTVIQAHIMTSCHTHAGSSSKNYCNYLPSGSRRCYESRPGPSGRELCLKSTTRPGWAWNQPWVHNPFAGFKTASWWMGSSPVWRASVQFSM